MKTLNDLLKTKSLNVEELMQIKGAAIDMQTGCGAQACHQGSCSGTACSSNACSSLACTSKSCGGSTCTTQGCTTSVMSLF